MEQRKIINAFNYSNVQKDSHWKKQFDHTKQYYLDISNYDLLYGFRRRVGLKAPSRQLGGWYGTGIFHIFGQIFGALSKMYAVTKEFYIKNKVIFLLEEWSKCIEPTGMDLTMKEDEGVTRGDTSNPHLWIKSSDQANQLFETVEGHVKGYESIQKRFVPFYKIGPRERYYLYNEMDSVYKKVR